MPETLEVVAKLAAYLAVVVAIGRLGAAWVARRVGDTPAAIDESLATITASAGTLLAATLVRAWAHTAAAFGRGEAWVWENLRLIAFESRWGEGWRLQAASALLLCVGAAAAAVSRGEAGGSGAAARRLTALAAVAAAFAVPQTGHAAAEPYRWVLHGLHVVGAGAWAGTLLALVSLRGDGRRALPRLLQAFDALAAPAVVVVGVTGLWASSLYLGGFGNLVSTEYGRLLLAKGSVVAVMAALGGVNWWRLRRPERVGLPLTVYLEAGLALGVVVLTAWLTETAHP